MEFAPLELPSIPPLVIEETTPKDTDATQAETPSSFPAVLIASIASAIVFASIGFVVFFKKRKQQH